MVTAEHTGNQEYQMVGLATLFAVTHVGWRPSYRPYCDRHAACAGF